MQPSFPLREKNESKSFRERQAFDFFCELRKKDLGRSGFAELLLSKRLHACGVNQVARSLAVQTHDPKTKVVPALIAGESNSKDAIEFFC